MSVISLFEFDNHFSTVFSLLCLALHTSSKMLSMERFIAHCTILLFHTESFINTQVCTMIYNWNGIMHWLKSWVLSHVVAYHEGSNIWCSLLEAIHNRSHTQDRQLSLQIWEAVSQSWRDGTIYLYLVGWTIHRMGSGFLWRFPHLRRKKNKQ